MISLTEQQISDAKNNDLEAVTAVIKATEENVIRLAETYARTKGAPDHNLAEELAQIGRVAIWESIKRFQGTSVGSFISYIDRTIKGAMADARKQETRRGVSVSVAAKFEYALRHSGGNPFKAERAATDPDIMGKRRITPETAYAARISWQGLHSLDALAAEDPDSDTPLAETIPGNLPIPGATTEAEDRENARRRIIRDRVHATLGQLGKKQRTVLKATYGIAPMPFYGTQNDAELGKDIDVPPSNVRFIRSHGHARFETLWLQGTNRHA